MKKILCKCLIAVSLVIGLSSCGNAWKAKHSQQTETTINGAMYGYVMVLNERGLDSLCFVDALPRDLDEWKATAYRDYETNKTVVKRMYIKELTETREAIYILIPKQQLYKITKRIVIEE